MLSLMRRVNDYWKKNEESSSAKVLVACGVIVFYGSLILALVASAGYVQAANALGNVIFAAAAVGLFVVFYKPLTQAA